MRKHPEMREQTRRRIIDAFWSLAMEKGVTKVNVSDITKMAGINRGTFYEYFLDVNDLIEFVETELLEDYKRKVLDIQAKYMLDDIKVMVRKVVELVTGYDDKFFILLSANGDTNFLTRLQKEMAAHYLEIVHSEKMIKQRDYVIVYFTSAMLGIITYWYECEKNISIEELSEIVFCLATKGLMGNLLPETDEVKTMEILI